MSRCHCWFFFNIFVGVLQTIFDTTKVIYTSLLSTNWGWGICDRK